MRQMAVLKTTSFALILLMLAAALTGFLAACSPTGREGGGLVINEVVTSNTNSCRCLSWFSDWIEIYNNSDNDIDLSGYVLRNSNKPSTFHIFPSIVVKAGEYVVIYACNKPRDESLWGYCTGFNLPKAGGALCSWIPI